MIRICLSRGLMLCTSRTNVSHGLRLSPNNSPVFVKAPFMKSPRRSLHAQVVTEDEEATREVTSRVQRIADEVLELNLLETADLAKILKERLGLDAIPMGGVGMMPAGAPMAAPSDGAAPGAAADDAPPVQEKTSFDVKLESFDKAGKIKVIKEVRAATELGLKEAKEMVEKAPVVIKTGIDKATAEELKKAIEEVGGVVVLE